MTPIHAFLILTLGICANHLIIESMQDRDQRVGKPWFVIVPFAIPAALCWALIRDEVIG